MSDEKPNEVHSTTVSGPGDSVLDAYNKLPRFILGHYDYQRAWNDTKARATGYAESYVQNGFCEPHEITVRPFYESELDSDFDPETEDDAMVGYAVIIQAPKDEDEDRVRVYTYEVFSLKMPDYDQPVEVDRVDYQDARLNEDSDPPY